MLHSPRSLSLRALRPREFTSAHREPKTMARPVRAARPLAVSAPPARLEPETQRPAACGAPTFRGLFRVSALLPFATQIQVFGTGHHRFAAFEPGKVENTPESRCRFPCASRQCAG